MELFGQKNRGVEFAGKEKVKPNVQSKFFTLPHDPWYYSWPFAATDMPSNHREVDTTYAPPPLLIPDRACPIYGTTEDMLPPWVVSHLQRWLDIAASAIKHELFRIADAQKLTHTTMPAQLRSNGEQISTKHFDEKTLQEIAFNLFGEDAVVVTPNGYAWASHSPPKAQPVPDLDESDTAAVDNLDDGYMSDASNSSQESMRNLLQTTADTVQNDNEYTGTRGVYRSRIEIAMQQLVGIGVHEEQTRFRSVLQIDKTVGEGIASHYKSLLSWSDKYKQILDANDTEKSAARKAKRAPVHIAYPLPDYDNMQMADILQLIRGLRSAYAKYSVEPHPHLTVTFNLARKAVAQFYLAKQENRVYTTAEIDAQDIIVAEYGFMHGMETVQADEQAMVQASDDAKEHRRLGLETSNHDDNLLTAGNDTQEMGIGIDRYDQMDLIELMEEFGFERFQYSTTFAAAKLIDKAQAHQ